jgi:hypothetical protein
VTCVESLNALVLTGALAVVVWQEEDEWCPAVIVRCRSVAVPHTSLQQKSFDVTYTAPAGKEGVAAAVPREEAGVKSDRIRLVQKVVETPAAPAIEESTGESDC